MRITYLDNSGFAVEMKKSLLLFDYYNHYADGGRQGFSGGVAEEAAFRKAERVYIFVSHRHYDHFNRIIFTFAHWNPDTTYILDAGIFRVPAGLNAHRLIKGEVFDDGYLRVRAHPSTDIGVSFQMEAEGKTLFHAGDLNCWHWAGDVPKEEEAGYRALFTKALAAIQPYMQQPDVAFFPVDARLKGPYDDGALGFIEAFRPRLFIPMHFQQNFAAAEKFAAKAADRQKVWVPARRGDSMDVFDTVSPDGRGQF